MNARSLLVAVLLVLTACSSTDVVSDTTLAEVEPSAPVAAEAPEEAQHPVDKAVAAVLEVGSYSFDATLRLMVSGNATTSDLHGWIDGNDRELVVESGGDSVRTLVVDGVATVERGGQVADVPIREAAEAPSLTILAEVEELTEVESGRFMGTLTVAALRGSGFDDATPVTVTISLDSNGTLAGYLLEASDGTWAADVAFEDIGQSFTG